MADMLKRLVLKFEDLPALKIAYNSTIHTYLSPYKEEEEEKEMKRGG